MFFEHNIMNFIRYMFEFKYLVLWTINNHHVSICSCCCIHDK